MAFWNSGSLSNGYLCGIEGVDFVRFLAFTFFTDFCWVFMTESKTRRRNESYARIGDTVWGHKMMIPLFSATGLFV